MQNNDSHNTILCLLIIIQTIANPLKDQQVFSVYLYIFITPLFQFRMWYSKAQYFKCKSINVTQSRETVPNRTSWLVIVLKNL